ncbi:unnamed protein product [Paramecium octaurelia]|uniref:Zinc finger PHD-type domain-containing protein n=1 Tax=Paramecium octaurelia TaxID=43137 RepID=A0A8S1WI67_PAROT|nr:unnamed protein product [Paramecium octaurelia]
MAQLEDYFDRQSHVPQEVTRSLRLIKELDEKVTKIQQKLTTLRKQYKQQQNEKTKVEIDQLYEESVNLSQEKINLSDKVYEVVDNAVQQLDNDLKKFEENLKSSMAPDHKRRFLILSKYQKEKRKKINQEIEQSKEIFQNASQSEPLYCICQKPSFGQMVMCDNQLCSKEWFHLECVKLKDFPPENEPWFCSIECRKEGKGRMKK